jgi:hypothetical protein
VVPPAPHWIKLLRFRPWPAELLPPNKALQQTRRLFSAGAERGSFGATPFGRWLTAARAAQLSAYPLGGTPAIDRDSLSCSPVRRVRSRRAATAVVLALVAGACGTPSATGTTIGDRRPAELGMSSSELIKSRGQPDRTRDRTEAGRTFRTFYYTDGTTYVVDIDRDIICEEGIGETDGYCYPCDYGATAGTCP